MGYRGNVNQSLIALCWLHQINETCEPIEYRLSRDGERKILDRFVDGYCEESNTVYQPRNLLFPVLPVRIDGKLIFPLCFACAKEKQEACNHVETECYLCGTWTSVEINKAVEKKYQIVEIF